MMYVRYARDLFSGWKFKRWPSVEPSVVAWLWLRFEIQIDVEIVSAVFISIQSSLPIHLLFTSSELMRNTAVWHLGSGAACSYRDEMQLMVPLKNSLISVIVIFHNQFAIMVIIFKWSPLGSFKNNNLIIIMGHSEKYWAHNIFYCLLFLELCYLMIKSINYSEWIPINFDGPEKSSNQSLK